MAKKERMNNRSRHALNKIHHVERGANEYMVVHFHNCRGTIPCSLDKWIKLLNLFSAAIEYEFLGNGGKISAGDSLIQGVGEVKC